MVGESNDGGGYYGKIYSNKRGKSNKSGEESKPKKQSAMVLGYPLRTHKPPILTLTQLSREREEVDDDIVDVLEANRGKEAEFPRVAWLLAGFASGCAPLFQAKKTGHKEAVVLELTDQPMSLRKITSKSPTTEKSMTTPRHQIQ